MARQRRSRRDAVGRGLQPPRGRAARLAWVFYWANAVVALATAGVFLAGGEVTTARAGASTAGLLLLFLCNQRVLERRDGPIEDVLAAGALMLMAGVLPQPESALPLFYTSLDFRVQRGRAADTTRRFLLHFFAFVAVNLSGGAGAVLRAVVLFQVVGFGSSAFLLWFMARTLRQAERLQRAAERGRRETRRGYRQIVNGITESLVVLDEDYRVVRANRTAVARHAERVQRGACIDGLVDLVRTPAVLLHHAAAQARRSGRAEFECWLHCGADEAVPFEVSLTPGRLHRRPVLVAVARDTSERHRLQEQLQRAQRMDAVGRVAGGVAHDFNNVLMAVVGHAEYTLTRLLPDDPLRAEQAGILAAVRRASGLTRQLLLFGRRHVYQPHKLRLDLLVDALRPLVRRVLAENVTLSFECEPVWVQADAPQLEQVLLNLVLNARDAMPQGGALTLRAGVRRVRNPLATVFGTLEPGVFAELVVEDTGEGMSPALQQQAFDPFFTTKAEGHGSGLGLSTVLGIVQRHGGGILLHSAPGRGACFTVLLPAVAPGEEAAAECTALPQPGSGHVLLVEDEPEVRRTLELALRSFGYRVTAVSRPRQALAAAMPEVPYDLLLSDVMLPEMNGAELYDRLRRQHPGLRVLFVSGYAEPTAQLEQDHPLLLKPFSWATLSRHVHQALVA